MIPRVSESLTPPDGAQEEALAPQNPPERKWGLTGWATTVTLVCIGCAVLSAAGIQWFGSAASAVAYLRGDRLIPDAYTKSFGTASKGERPSVEFRLMNFTKRSIKVLGSNASCTCLVTSDLPMVVPQGGQAILRVIARSKLPLRPYSERLQLLTDSGEPSIVLSVQGVFH